MTSSMAFFCAEEPSAFRVPFGQSPPPEDELGAAGVRGRLRVGATGAQSEDAEGCHGDGADAEQAIDGHESVALLRESDFLNFHRR